MEDHFVELIISIVLGFLASSGFWFFLDKRLNKKNLQTELLIGLAHDRLVYLGIKYIKRGYITQDEYENIEKYLYKPYHNLGGNGTVDRIMAEINKLPIKSQQIIEKEKE